MKRLLFALVAVFCGAAVLADDAEFCAAYQNLVDNRDVPGAVVVIASPTEILEVHEIGFADLDAKTPIRDDSQFWIASNTKAFVAVATMICVEEGLLDLDAPVDAYLPQLKNLKVARAQDDGTTLLVPVAKAPTLRQSLSHTAGFRFITPFQEAYGIDSLPVQRHMTVVGQTPLIDEPGARYSYSNLGIDVAQAAVEVVTKKPFEVFLKERVLDPLEMTDTTFYPNDDQLKRLATPYRWDGEKKKLAPFRFTQTPSIDDGSPRYAEGGGGLFSSAKDFVKFYQMLGGKGVGANGKRILSESSVETIGSKQTGESLKDEYGFGVVTPEEWFGHGGAYGTQGVAYRDGSVVGIYMVALGGIPKQGEAERLFRARLAEVAKERGAK